MAINDSYTKAEAGVPDAASLIIDGTETETGAAEITELGGTGDAEVYREVDVNNDGDYDISVRIADPNDPDVPTADIWHSQDNNLTVSDKNNLRLRIENISGVGADFYATGFEVDD